MAKLGNSMRRKFEARFETAMEWKCFSPCCSSLKDVSFLTLSELIKPLSHQAAQLGIHFFAFTSQCTSLRYLIKTLLCWMKEWFERKNSHERESNQWPPDYKACALLLCCKHDLLLRISLIETSYLSKLASFHLLFIMILHSTDVNDCCLLLG